MAQSYEQETPKLAQSGRSGGCRESWPKTPLSAYRPYSRQTGGRRVVMLIAVLTAYSAQSPQLVGRFLAVLFFVIGGVVVWEFASMEKNWILSRIDRTEPGELNFEFWIQATAVVAVPLIGILVHLFPSIGGFMSSLAPSLEALR